jgi:transposase
MNKKDFKDLIDKGHSQREIGNILHQGQTTVRYWLNKYGLKTNTSEKSFVYKCGACGEKDPAKFIKVL